jgi:hypothetical protein
MASQDTWIVDRIKRRIPTMVVIISTLSFLHKILWFIHSTFIHIFFTHSLHVVYLPLATFLNHAKKVMPVFSCSFFQHPENQTIYLWWGSPRRFQHNTQQLQWSSRWQFRIWQQDSSAIIQASNGQPAVKWFLHVNTWKQSHANWIYFYVGATPASWVSERL